MSLEDTKSMDSSDYDSISLTESINGVGGKIKKKKKTSLFHKKHKEEKNTYVMSEKEKKLVTRNQTSIMSFDQHAESHFHNSSSSIYSTTSSHQRKIFLRDPPTHKLHVILIRGENLAPRDTNGLSDPYVKFKVNGRTAYKSQYCKETLDPHWNEEFELALNLQCDVQIRVYDHDFASRDDFMGQGMVDLTQLHKDFNDISIRLEENDSTEDLGYIHLQARLQSLSAGDFKKSKIEQLEENVLPRQDSVSSINSDKANVPSKSSIRNRKATVVDRSKPVAIATVQLVSGSGLPARDTNGLSDPYVKLGLYKSKKKKSKVCYKTLDPAWREEFTFSLFSSESSLLDITVWDKDSYRKDDFIGRCELDLFSLTREKTHSLQLSLVDTPGTILLLVTVHSVDAPEDSLTPYDLSEIRLKYGVSSTFHDLSDVGFAELKIISASGLRSADINGKSDPFCVVQLCNARAQTHTCYKTLDPVWNRVFYFSLYDVHDVFDLWIFDQDQNEEREFLGRVCVPILRCNNGEEQTYCLKDKKLQKKVKGTITVKISYIYNPMRAAVRTFSPREEAFMNEADKFKIYLLKRNFSRVWRISQHILRAIEFINACFTWRNKERSLIAFVMFLLIVWNFELYMVPLVLLMLLIKNYVDIFVRKIRPPSHLMITEEAEKENVEDDDEEEENKDKSLFQRLRAIEDVLLKVQVVLDDIASFGERVYNAFIWTVPYLGWLLMIVLCVVYLVLYFIPLRTIILLWGINKFTKKLRKPDYVSNNEVLDYLSRIPSNIELEKYRVYQQETSPTRKKR